MPASRRIATQTSAVSWSGAVAKCTHFKASPLEKLIVGRAGRSDGRARLPALIGIELVEQIQDADGVFEAKVVLKTRKRLLKVPLRVGRLARLRRLGR